MSAGRRHSRTPLGLMQDEAVLMVQAAENDPGLREAAEVFTGREWSTLTTKEKVDALLQRDAISRAAGAMAGGMRGMRDLKTETELARYGVSQEDMIADLRTQLAEQVGKLERLTEENRQLRAENSTAKAQSARAVHSGEAA